MKTKFTKALVLLTLIVAMVAMMAMPAMAAGGSVSLLDGQVTVSSSNSTSLSLSGGSVTGTGKANGLSGTNTFQFVVTNTAASTATISFDYKYSNVDGNSENSSSGTKTVTLKSSETCTLTMDVNGGWFGKTGSLVLSNFTIVLATGTSNVTVNYNNALGSVMADGGAVVSNTVLEVSPSEGVELSATPVSGAKFLAWINTADNSVVSTSASFAYITTEDASLKAVFTTASAEPCLWAADKAYLFESLHAAISYTSSSSNKVITLASDATMPAGNYTIPAGVTLNIPYDAAGTLCTKEPTCHEDTYTAPTVFCTLNLAEGANITVNGTLSLSAAQSSKYNYNGMPSGPLPFINMASGSKITVESGACLYAWGYITGSGSVEVKSGGTVYECFQIADYRGGDATTSIVAEDDKYGVFPFNQYYIQNIEVPMTLHAGAKENGYTSVQVAVVGDKHSNVPFIGSDNSMFVVNSGYVVKDYMEGTGRLDVKIYGNVSVSTIKMTMQVGIDIPFISDGTIDIDSSKYALPIAQHLTISVESGNISMDQSVAFLPGSELYIKEGAFCELGAGKKIVLYDLDQWTYNNGANGYSGTSNLPYVRLPYVPGGNGTTGRLKDALIQVDGTINASAGAVYTTTGGANVYSTGTGEINLKPGTETVTYQIITNGTNISSWPEIAIQPAILRDADGSEVPTDTAGTYKYFADAGRWDTPNHFYDDGVVTDPTCVAQGYTTYTCAVCGGSKVENGEPAHGVHEPYLVPGTAATCTNPGVSDGWYCPMCEQIVEGQEEIPVLGHTEEITPATATLGKGGYSEGKYCSDCGVVLVQPVEMPALSAVGQSMTLSGELTFNLNVDIHDSIKETTAVTVKFGDAETVYNASNLPEKLQIKIAAAQMADEITLHIVNGTDSVTKTYSVEAYAEIILNDDQQSKYHDLVQAMLNYGAAAQTYFVYNDKPLVSNQTGAYNVPETVEKEMSVAGAVEGLKFYGATLVYREKIAVRFYFVGSIEVIDFGDYEVVEKDGMYYVEIAEILPQNLDQQITLTVTDADNNSLTVAYSPMNYIVRMNQKGGKELKALVRELYNYYIAAKNVAAAA